MLRTLSFLILVAALSVTSNGVLADDFGRIEQRFQIDFVEIGCPGNSPDEHPLPNPAASDEDSTAWIMMNQAPSNGPGLLTAEKLRQIRSKQNPIGGVGYRYRISKYEVSREMISRANRSGNLKIIMSDLSKLNCQPHPRLPATGISWG